MRIRLAKELIDKIDYSNIDDYQTYPDSIFICDNCGDKIRFAYKDLEKHRFSKNSNLKGLDKKNADRLILSMIPKYKIDQKGQIWALTKRDRIIVKFQRLILRLIGLRENFLPIPSINENIPGQKKLSGYSPKIMADFYIDDKALRFKGSATMLRTLKILEELV